MIFIIFIVNISVFIVAFADADDNIALLLLFGYYYNQHLVLLTLFRNIIILDLCK